MPVKAVLPRTLSAWGPEDSSGARLPEAAGGSGHGGWSREVREARQQLSVLPCVLSWLPG